MAAEEGNKYAEKWTLEESISLLENALELSKTDKYDFIGEIAKKLGVYHELFNYLANKFPQLSHYPVLIKSNCEASCFSNGKKGNIIPSLAIMNLKSNHGWTDRVDNTTKGGEINTIIDLGNGE